MTHVSGKDWADPYPIATPKESNDNENWPKNLHRRDAMHFMGRKRGRHVFGNRNTMPKRLQGHLLNVGRAGD